MKKYIISLFATAALLTACVDLNLTPYATGSAENWYNNEEEITASLNALYAPSLWYMECTRLYNTDRFTDDWNQRTQLYDWVGGTIDGNSGIVTSSWSTNYKMVARANTWRRWKARFPTTSSNSTRPRPSSSAPKPIWC